MVQVVHGDQMDHVQPQLFNLIARFVRRAACVAQLPRLLDQNCFSPRGAQRVHAADRPLRILFAHLGCRHAARRIRPRQAGGKPDIQHIHPCGARGAEIIQIVFHLCLRGRTHVARAQVGEELLKRHSAPKILFDRPSGNCEGQRRTPDLIALIIFRGFIGGGIGHQYKLFHGLSPISRFQSATARSRSATRRPHP